ncbi:hypothetical protein L4C31_10650 [Aliivibrio sifiae]
MVIKALLLKELHANGVRPEDAIKLEDGERLSYSMLVDLILEMPEHHQQISTALHNIKSLNLDLLAYMRQLATGINYSIQAYKG